MFQMQYIMNIHQLCAEDQGPFAWKFFSIWTWDFRESLRMRRFCLISAELLQDIAGTISDMHCAKTILEVSVLAGHFLTHCPSGHPCLAWLLLLNARGFDQTILVRETSSLYTWVTEYETVKITLLDGTRKAIFPQKWNQDLYYSRYSRFSSDHTLLWVCPIDRSMNWVCRNHWRYQKLCDSFITVYEREIIRWFLCGICDNVL